MTPRIRARIGTVEEPPELKGQFCFEVFLALSGEGEGQKMGDFGPFKTEALAKTRMREVCRTMSETIEKEITGKVSGKYLDIKTNEFRNWDEH